MIILPEWICRDLTARFYANLYVILTAILSLSLLLWYPSLQAPHESQHFLRGLTLSPLYVNGTLPVNVVRFSDGTRNAMRHFPEMQRRRVCLQLKHLDLNPLKRIPYVSGWPVTHYPFVDYMPQIIAGAVGWLVSLSPATIYTITRILCLLSGIAFGYIILRLLPAYHVPAMMILLLPSGWMMRVVQYPDYVADIASLLYFALIVRALYRGAPIGWKQVLAIGITGIVLSVSKVIFFPLTLSVLLIPARQFKSVGHRIACLGLIIGMCFCASVINGVTSYDDGYRANIVNIVDGDRGDHPSRAIIATQRLLEHPVDVLHVAVSTYSSLAYWKQKILEMFLWWDNAPRLFRWKMMPFWIALSPCFLALTRGNYSGAACAYRPRATERLCLLDLVLLQAIILALAIYIEFSPVDAPVIPGIQGRYFVPLLPLLMLCFSIRLPDKWFRPCIFFQLVACLAVLLILYGSLFGQWMMI